MPAFPQHQIPLHLAVQMGEVWTFQEQSSARQFVNAFLRWIITEKQTPSLYFAYAGHADVQTRCMSGLSRRTLNTQQPHTLAEHHLRRPQSQQAYDCRTPPWSVCSWDF